MTPTFFWNFGEPATGRLVTARGDLAIINARNPYGTHSLVLYDRHHQQALRHGTATVLCCAYEWMGERAYRRVRKFLAARGIGLDWRLARMS